MAHPLTLPTTIGLLALAGAATGIYLGKDSISQINPIYFRDPPTRFHSDLSAYQAPATAGYDRRAEAVGMVDPAAGCFGCRVYPEEYYPQHDSAVDGFTETYSEPAGPVELAVAQAAPDADLLRRQADLERVERYSRPPISPREETEAAVPTPAAVPADAETTAIQGDEVGSAD